jgi:hypothetical protein
LLTLQEIKERLSHYDELTLLEILDVSSEELIDRFEDLIEEQYERLVEELSDEYRPDDGHGE